MDYFRFVTDVTLTYDTDLDFADGDLMRSNGVDAVKRKIYALLITEPGDWKLYPDEGASLNPFIGEHNTRDTARRIEEYIIDKIQSHVVPATVGVKVVPLSRESVKCYLDLSLAGVEITHIPFTMDFINGFIYPQIDERVDTVVSSNSLRFNDTASLSHPNPFWDRLRGQ
jgi:hypothetical protein